MRQGVKLFMHVHTLVEIQLALAVWPKFWPRNWIRPEAQGTTGMSFLQKGKADTKYEMYRSAVKWTVLTAWHATSLALAVCHLNFFVNFLVCYITLMYEGISPRCSRAAGHTLVDKSFPLLCLFMDSSGIKWPSWAVTVAQVSCACKRTGSLSNAFKIPARKVNKTCRGCMKIERKQVPCQTN